jgi:phospholipid-binding lipoprotein MlaA
MDISPDSGFQNIISQDPVSEDVKGVVTLFIAQLRRNEVWNALSCDIFLGLLKMIAFSVSSLRRAALAVALCTGLAACSTTGTSSEIDDPMEGFNRAVFAFNDAADRALIRPIAIAYRTVVPKPARTGLRNFTQNLRAPVNFTNEVLQGDAQGAERVFVRTMVNSFIGLGGLIDVAAMEGLPYDQEDFGQTLAVWGMGHGPYVVLPVLGPSSVRDASGVGVDMMLDPMNWYFYNVRPKNEGWRYARAAAEGVVKREELLDALDDLRRNSFDYYAAMRSAYVQRRAAMVRDGRAEAMPSYYDEL